MADPVPYVTPAPSLPANYANVTPRVPASQTTYTQTYSIGAATVPTATAVAVATTAATNVIPYGFAQAQADAIVTAVNALVADVLANRKLLNALIDDLQAAGISL